MKNVILIATLAAMTATFAAPSFAMENPVRESSAKIESILAHQKAERAGLSTPTVRATTFSTKTPASLTPHEAIIARLFGNQSVPSGR